MALLIEFSGIGGIQRAAVLWFIGPGVILVVWGGQS
jgi:hypothetical protein